MLKWFWNTNTWFIRLPVHYYLPNYPTWNLHPNLTSDKQAVHVLLTHESGVHIFDIWLKKRGSLKRYCHASESTTTLTACIYHQSYMCTGSTFLPPQDLIAYPYLFLEWIPGCVTLKYGTYCLIHLHLWFSVIPCDAPSLWFRILVSCQLYLTFKNQINSIHIHTQFPSLEKDNTHNKIQTKIKVESIILIEFCTVPISLCQCNIPIRPSSQELKTLSWFMELSMWVSVVLNNEVSPKPCRGG